MLVGRVPFRGDSPISIALQHINEDIEFTPEEKTKIPHSIRTLISKMTDKSKCRRSNRGYRVHREKYRFRFYQRV